MRLDLGSSWQRNELLQDFELSSPHSTETAALICFRAHGIQRSRWLVRGGVLTLSGMHLKLAESEADRAVSLRVLLPEPVSEPLAELWIRLSPTAVEIRSPYHNHRGALIQLRETPPSELSSFWNPHGVAFTTGSAGVSAVTDLSGSPEGTPSALLLTRLIDPYDEAE